ENCDTDRGPFLRFGNPGRERGRLVYLHSSLTMVNESGGERVQWGCYRLVLQTCGHREKATVRDNRGYIFMLHAELPAGGSVKTKEFLRRELPGHKPVVRFEDNQGKPVDRFGVSIEEVLFGAFDVDLEQKRNVGCA